MKKKKLLEQSQWKKIKDFFINYETDDIGLNYAIEVLTTDKYLVSYYVFKVCMKHLLFFYKFLHDETFPYFYDFQNVKISYIYFKLQIIPETKKNYILAPYRAFMLSVILGFRHKDNHLKLLVREIMDTEGRKNGKSTFWAIFSIYVASGFLGDGYPRVFIAGPIKESSDIIYKLCGDMIKNNPYLEKEFFKNNQLYIKHNDNGQINKMAFDKANIEGQNPTLTILTEFHLHPDKRMQESARTAMNMSRPSQLIVYDTTKGQNMNYPYYSQEKTFKGFLDRQIETPDIIDKNAHIFLFCAELDDDKYDQWANPKNWPMTNPNIGITLDINDLIMEFNTLDTKLDLIDFKVKRIGMWINQGSAYFEISDILENQEINKEIYEKFFIQSDEYKKLTCILGLDLSNSQDTTALIATWEIPTADNENIWIIKHLGFIPQTIAQEKERRDQVPYFEWRDKGFLEMTIGETIDYNIVADKVKSFTELYNVKKLTYDNWQYRFIKNDILKRTYFSKDQLIEVKQGVSLTPSIKEFERKLKRKKLYIVDDNEMLMNHILNISMRPSRNANDNFYPEKLSFNLRIDGAMAMFTALFERCNIDNKTYDFKPSVINLS